MGKKFPKLIREKRAVEYKKASEEQIGYILYGFLFQGKTTQELDNEVLDLNQQQSKIFSTVSILNYLGLRKQHNSFFKENSLEEAINILLLNLNENRLIANHLKRYADKHGYTINLNQNKTDFVVTKSNIVNKPNFPWSKDELILALELYFDCYPSIPSPSNSKIIELSKILNIINYQISGEKDIFLRTPDSVVMKLSNFLRLDSRYLGKGLSKGSKLEKIIWERFSKNIIELKEISAQIKILSANEDFDNRINDFDEIEEFEEGKILTILHKRRERNQKLIKMKKFKVLNTTGKLLCEICDFDFEAKYGELGKGYIECHHNKPISSLKENETNKLSDLSILCSNCHRMIHRIRPWKSVLEMKEIINL